jgi:hypothetical protein
MLAERYLFTYNTKYIPLRTLIFSEGEHVLFLHPETEKRARNPTSEGSPFPFFD